MNPQSTEMQKKKQWLLENSPYSDHARLLYYSKFQPSSVENEETNMIQNIAVDIWKPKSNEEIRFRYLQKLGIFKMEPKKQCQHFFVVDWDDTLFCTSFFKRINYTFRSKDKSKLQKLDNIVVKVLSGFLQSVKQADMVIATNGSLKWVQTSSEMYLPKTRELIKKRKIPIMSGRDLFEKQYPEQFYLWKQKMFEMFLTEFKLNSNILTNFICVGDSDIEMQAAKKFTKWFDKIVLKKIKFMKSPSLSNLIKSLAIIETKVKEIAYNPKGISVKLLVEKKKKQEEEDQQEEE